MQIIRQLLFASVAGIAVLCLMPRGAEATTITFNDLEQPDGGLTFMNSYTDAGFTFRSITKPNDPNALVSCHQQNDGFQGCYAGSAGLSIFGGPAYYGSLSDGGMGFSFSSIDLSLLRRDVTGTAMVTFTGNFIGGGTTSQTFAVSQFGFHTFTFNSTFTNLASVDFGPQTLPFFQLDNVVVNANSSAVPEPATILLAGSALLAVGLFKRRRDEITGGYGWAVRATTVLTLQVKQISIEAAAISISLRMSVPQFPSRPHSFFSFRHSRPRR